MSLFNMRYFAQSAYTLIALTRLQGTQLANLTAQLREDIFDEIPTRFFRKSVRNGAGAGLNSVQIERIDECWIIDKHRYFVRKQARRKQLTVRTYSHNFAAMFYNLFVRMRLKINVESELI